MIMWNRIRRIFAWFRGKTDARILYDCVRSYASISSTTICMLHLAENRTPCLQSRYYCGAESKVSVLNFDKIKDMYCHKNRLQSLPSVDAVSYKNSRFLFIEIKSWQNFERFQISGVDAPTDIAKKIKDKAAGFKLKSKIEKSMEICSQIANDKKLFGKIPVTYVLVTDVDTVEDPMIRFKSRLRILSYKSVYIPLYNKEVKNQIATIGMDVRYVFCRSFDQFYKKL